MVVSAQLNGRGTEAPQSCRRSSPVSLARKQWPFLLLAGCAIATVSLGIHDIMLTRLHVPYPHTAGLPLWASYIDVVVRLTAFVWLCRAAMRRLGGVKAWQFAVMGGFFLVMLNETTRVLVIEAFLTKGGWTQGGWVFILVGKLPVALTWFCYGAMTALAARQLHSRGMRVTAVLVIAAFGLFALQPILAAAANSAQDMLRSLDLPQHYAMPFPPKIYFVIYATFIEPTIAAMAMAALVWPSLRGGSWRRAVGFATLLLLVRGRVVSFFLFSFWVSQPLRIGFLSESQFFLETLCLGVLSAAVWARIEPASVASEVA